MWYEPSHAVLGSMWGRCAQYVTAADLMAMLPTEEELPLLLAPVEEDESADTSGLSPLPPLPPVANSSPRKQPQVVSNDDGPYVPLPDPPARKNRPSSDFGRRPPP
jgi:hypothetical protein